MLWVYRTDHILAPTVFDTAKDLATTLTHPSPQATWAASSLNFVDESSSDNEYFDDDSNSSGLHIRSKRLTASERARLRVETTTDEESENEATQTKMTTPKTRTNPIHPARRIP